MPGKLYPMHTSPLLRVLACLLVALLLPAPLHAQAAKRPNILWLSYEDSSQHLGCYGNPHISTPHLDAFAKKAVRYTHAFTIAGVCAPSRSGIITGMYPTTIGSQHMRSQATLPDHIKTFPTYLREAGYYCSNNVKTDYNLVGKSQQGTWDESSNKAHYKNRKEGQPFFAVFNFTQSHESQFHAAGRNFPNGKKVDPAKLTLPPYYPDTPLVRQDWAQNYQSISQVDFLIGQKLKELEEAGLADDTIVLIWSDHGDGLPRAKRWLYDSGTRIVLMAHVPEKFRTPNQAAPGSVSDELISGIDLGPTVLNLAGIKVPDHVQGRAFLGPNLGKPRDYVFAARDRMDERYDMIRTVRDKRYRYVRNYMPWVPYSQYIHYNEQGNVAGQWRRLHEEGKLTGPAKAWFADRKPAEELYDTHSDPHEVNNLAAVPEHAQTLKRMREAHQQWQREMLDLGPIPEPVMNELAGELGSQYAILRHERMGPIMELTRSIMSLPAATPDQAMAAFKALVQIQTRHVGDALLDDPTIAWWTRMKLTESFRLTPPPGDAGRVFVNDLRPRGDDGGKMHHDVVRVAAARGAALNGQAAAAIPVLINLLKHENEYIRLAAALVLDEMGDDARPAIEALKAAKAADKSGGKYIARVATRALNQMLGTDDPL